MEAGRKAFCFDVRVVGTQDVVRQGRWIAAIPS